MAVANQSFQLQMHHQIKVDDFKIVGNTIIYLAAGGKPTTTMTRICSGEDPATLLANLMARGPDMDMVMLFMSDSR